MKEEHGIPNDPKDIYVEGLVKILEEAVRVHRPDIGQDAEEVKVNSAVMNNFYMKFKSARAVGAESTTFRDRYEVGEYLDPNKTPFEEFYLENGLKRGFDEAEITRRALKEGHSFNHLHQTRREFYQAVDQAAVNAGLDLEQIAEDIREAFENPEKFHENTAKLMPAFKELLKQGYGGKDLR